MFGVCGAVRVDKLLTLASGYFLCVLRPPACPCKADVACGSRLSVIYKTLRLVRLKSFCPRYGRLVCVVGFAGRRQSGDGARGAAVVVSK